MKYPCNSLRIALPLLLWASAGSAQIVTESGPYSLTTEAFANLTVAGIGDEEDGRDADSFDALGDAELRLLGLYKFDEDWSFGPRVTFRASNLGRDGIAERSLILRSDDYGRIEYGRRRGLPDVLTGYAPNNYQFVSAEYGPASGRSLDPDGGLQTAFLTPALGGQIGELSSLGITSSLFGDESTKLIYVSPKRKGFQGGLSYAPDAGESDDRFGRLVQGGLTHDRYWKQNVLHVGGSYAYAEGETGFDDLHSFSAGAALTLDDALTLAASATYNGDSGLPNAAAFDSDAYGLAASVNYNTGPWTVGGFYQHARAEGDAALPGNDQLDAVQLGVSYRTSTHVRLYSAAYFYDFEDEGGAAGDPDGAIVLAGIRLNL